MLRLCKFKIFENRKLSDWKMGSFHGFGINHEELRDGIGHYSVGIIEENETGKIYLVSTDDICFKLN